MDGKTMLIGFGLILMILGLLFSASRMGIASLLLSFSLISLFFRDPDRGHRFSRTSVMVLGLAILWAAWIGLDAVLNRFFSTSSDDLESRWRIWVNTFQILKDFPIFGSGLGTFAQIFPMYRSFHIRGVVTHAENDFLQLASEVGLVGAGLLFVLFVYLFCKAAAGILKLPNREPLRYIGISGLISILALTFHSIGKEYPGPANACLFTFIWALVLTISSQGDREAEWPGGSMAQ
jgi:O-antigen ligase